MATTPRVIQKRSPNSPGDETTTCPICLDPIIDATEDTEGQEAIYCESTCNGWIHKQCAGLSRILYKAYEDGDDPFYCPHCRLTLQEQQLLELKLTIDGLQKEVTNLKADQPNEVTCSQNINEESQPATQLASSSHKTPDTDNTKQQAATTMKSNKSGGGDKTWEDRQFNIVIYGIQECSKGTPRNEQLAHGLDKVTNLITQGENSVSPLSIRDLLRLGKYHDQSKNPRLILVKLNRTMDVTTLLTKARSLSKENKIKPDLTQEERLIESLLLKERWSLIQAGTEGKAIRIHTNKIFANNRLHGQIVDSSFVPQQPKSSEAVMDTSNN